MEDRKKNIYLTLWKEAKDLGKKAEFVSFSKVEKYKSCPLRFKYAYIDKIKTDVSSVYLELGTLSHDMIEKTFKHKLSKDTRVSEFMKKAKSIVNNFGYDESFAPYTSLVHYFENSVLLSFLEKGKGHIEFEVPVYDILWETDTTIYYFVGFIDMVVHKKDGIEIYDFKISNKSGYTGNKLEEAIFQLYLYAYIYSKNHNVNISNISYVFLKYINIEYMLGDKKHTKSYLERKDLINYDVTKCIDSVMKREYTQEDAQNKLNEFIDTLKTIYSDKEYKGKECRDYFCDRFCEYSNICTNNNKADDINNIIQDIFSK